jgi:hypothetical protein
MSYQLGDACFETVGAAAKAAAAASIGQVLPAGGSAYVVNAVGAADGSVSYTLHELGTSATLTHTYTPAYPDCVLLGAADAVEMGWGVIAAWVLAWAVLAIRRALV